MDSFKVNIVKFEKSIVAQILVQSNEVTKKLTPGIACGNFYFVADSYYPQIIQLSNGKIFFYCQGYKKYKDFRLITKEFESNQGRDNFCKSLKRALRDLKNQLQKD